MSVANFQELIDYFDYRLRAACLRVTSLGHSNRRSWMKKKLAGEIHVALSHVAAAYGRGFTPSVPPFLSALSRELQPPETVSFDIDSIKRAMERAHVTRATTHGEGIALDWWTTLDNENAPKRSRPMTDNVPELLEEYRRHKASTTLAGDLSDHEVFADEDVPENELFSEEEVFPEVDCAENELFPDDVDTSGWMDPLVLFPSEDGGDMSVDSAMVTSHPETGIASDERDAEVSDVARAMGDGQVVDPVSPSPDRGRELKRGQASQAPTDANPAPAKRPRRDRDERVTASPHQPDENTAPAAALRTVDTNTSASSPSRTPVFRIRMRLTHEQNDILHELRTQMGTLRREVEALEFVVENLQNRVENVEHQQHGLPATILSCLRGRPWTSRSVKIRGPSALTEGRAAQSPDGANALQSTRDEDAPLICSPKGVLKRGHPSAAAADANPAPTKRDRRDGSDTESASPNPGDESNLTAPAVHAQHTNVGAAANNVLRRQPSMGRIAVSIRSQLTQEQHHIVGDLQREFECLREDIDALRTDVETLKHQRSTGVDRSPHPRLRLLSQMMNMDSIDIGDHDDSRQSKTRSAGGAERGDNAWVKRAIKMPNDPYGSPSKTAVQSAGRRKCVGEKSDQNAK
ncbi:hypothetical protein FPV67DRAFT_1456622 [Lyophyllum atratum]|nr:hypothetical protein FPV67DRAFT_1456622 [Lyophyllum atratum]